MAALLAGLAPKSSHVDFSAQHAPDSAMQKILETVDAQLETSLERLFAFLRIPSISAQPAHKPDCLRPASWVITLLTDMVFPARLSETTGLPGIIATNHE